MPFNRSSARQDRAVPPRQRAADPPAQFEVGHVGGGPSLDVSQNDYPQTIHANATPQPLLVDSSARQLPSQDDFVASDALILAREPPTYPGFAYHGRPEFEEELAASSRAPVVTLTQTPELDTPSNLCFHGSQHAPTTNRQFHIPGPRTPSTTTQGISETASDRTRISGASLPATRQSQGKDLLPLLDYMSLTVGELSMVLLALKDRARRPHANRRPRAERVAKFLQLLESVTDSEDEDTDIETEHDSVQPVASSGPKAATRCLKKKNNRIKTCHEYRNNGLGHIRCYNGFGCTAVFSDRRGLDRHLGISDPYVSWICPRQNHPKCQRPKPTVDGLVSHLQHVHGQIHISVEDIDPNWKSIDRDTDFSRQCGFCPLWMPPYTSRDELRTHVICHENYFRRYPRERVQWTDHDHKMVHRHDCSCDVCTATIPLRTQDLTTMNDAARDTSDDEGKDGGPAAGPGSRPGVHLDPRTGAVAKPSAGRRTRSSSTGGGSTTRSTATTNSSDVWDLTVFRQALPRLLSIASSCYTSAPGVSPADIEYTIRKAYAIVAQTKADKARPSARISAAPSRHCRRRLRPTPSVVSNRTWPPTNKTAPHQDFSPVLRRFYDEWQARDIFRMRPERSRRAS